MTPDHNEHLAIDIQNLSLYAKEINILSGITLPVPQGAVVGLVGRNGAGKSSLLRSIVGLAAPDEGGCKLLGYESSNLPDTALERLGYVAQTPDLFEWMEVWDMLRTVGQAYPHWREDRCLQLATRLGLKMGGKVKNLSGGDQQKLAVVLALAHDPDILVLDEPVSNLDPLTRNEFMRALFAERMAQDQPDENGLLKDRTIIISSHLLTDLERVVSHIGFMRDGRLQLFDTWDSMQEHFRLIPASVINVPAGAIVCENRASQQIVIDNRLAPQQHDEGRTLRLDELFAELNA